LRRSTNALRAIFKSHFTLLRVKRLDTALCEKKKGSSERVRNSEERNMKRGRE